MIAAEEHACESQNLIKSSVTFSRSSVLDKCKKVRHYRLGEGGALL